MKKLCPHKPREAGASLASKGAWSFLLPRKEGERVSFSSLQALSLHVERVLTAFDIYSRGKAQKAGQQSPRSPRSSGPSQCPAGRRQSAKRQVAAGGSLNQLHS